MPPRPEGRGRRFRSGITYGIDHFFFLVDFFLPFFAAFFLAMIRFSSNRNGVYGSRCFGCRKISKVKLRYRNKPHTHLSNHASRYPECKEECKHCGQLLCHNHRLRFRSDGFAHHALASDDRAFDLRARASRTIAHSPGLPVMRVPKWSQRRCCNRQPASRLETGKNAEKTAGFMDVVIDFLRVRAA